MNTKKSGLIIILSVVILAIIIFWFLKTNNQIQVNNNQENNNYYESTENIDIEWLNYSNKQIGIEFEYPNQALALDSYTQSFCSGSEFVPYKVFTDDTNLFIKPEYYYFRDVNNDCQKVYNTFESLMAWAEKYKNAADIWHIQVADIENESQLAKYINQNFGLGSCQLDGLVPAEQTGVFDVEIKGDGLDLGSTKCPINWMLNLKYVPDLNKLFYWGTGQECQIRLQFSPDCLDQEIERRMIFN